jgi:dipeptidyl aminopeptidase/acylaminoacyl peptidase
MKIRLLATALILTNVSFYSAGIRAAEPPPVEAFGAVPSVSGVSLSPDGHLLAWYDESGKEPNVVMFDLSTRQFKRTIPVGTKAKPRSLNWADNETLLIEISYFDPSGASTTTAYNYEMYRTIAADVSGGKDRVLLLTDPKRTRATGAPLISPRAKNPKSVLMWTWNYRSTAAKQQTGSRIELTRRDSGWLNQVFEVDTRTGLGKVVETGSNLTYDWVVNANHDVVARSDWDPASETFTVLAKNGNGWRELLRTQHQSVQTLYGVDREGKSLIVGGHNALGRSTLMAYPLDGSPSKALFDDPTTGVLYVSNDRFTYAPISVMLEGLEPKMQWFDPQAEKRFRAIANAFPGKAIGAYEYSQDNKRVLAKVQSPSSPPIYYLVDFDTHKADIVGETYPALANATFGEVRPIAYKARDGISIPAFLTLPPGSTSTHLPLVVMPHGGPEDQDDYAFDWWAQFLASRGYAVLQPQFRGSTGLGEAWRKAGYKQWGKLMQDDVSDGVRAMIDQGIADARRVCIVGHSYGGYSALAGAAFTPELYRCAVSINGISDLPEYLSYVKRHWGEESGSFAYWEDHIGSPFDKEVIAKSPAKAASGVTAAMLLMHATQDTVVPINQSQAMARALNQAAKPATLIELDGEDHWLSRSETRERVLKELERFLAANLQTQ